MKRLKVLRPLFPLTACILLSAALTQVLPAGQYERGSPTELKTLCGRAAGEREEAIPGSYHRVKPQPIISPIQLLAAIGKGIMRSADIILLVLFAGGAFAVVDETGGLRQSIGWLVGKLQSSASTTVDSGDDRHWLSQSVHKLQTWETLVIIVISTIFALGGVFENLQEEIIALVPVLLLLNRRLGFDALAAVAMSAGAAAVGASFSPLNPFQVIIAQNLAGVAVFSGAPFRVTFLLAALAIWILGTLRYARRNRIEREQGTFKVGAIGFRTLIILGVVLGTFAVFVTGVLCLGWSFYRLSVLFLVMGFVCGLAGGLGTRRTGFALAKGFKSMAFAALLIGLARTISIVFEEGRVIDTIVNGLATSLGDMPRSVYAVWMMIAQAIIHVPVSSVSTQAALTMPILVPLSHILDVAPQVTVLAYQYGAGLCDLITPTSAALIAVLKAADVPYGEWLKFVVPRYLILLGLGALAVITGISIGLT